MMRGGDRIMVDVDVGKLKGTVNFRQSRCFHSELLLP